MTSPPREPRLRELLQDPIVQILMHRDSVIEEHLLEMMDDARRRIFEPEDPLPERSWPEDLLELVEL